MARPKVEGLWTQKYKDGFRYLLKGKDDTGKYVFVTVPIDPKDSNTIFIKKCEAARKSLEEKIHPPKTFQYWMESYFTKRHLTESTKYQYRHYLAGMGFNDAVNAKLTDDVLSRAKTENTRRQVIGIINTFFKFIIGEGVQVKNPVAGVRSGHVTHRTRTPTADETTKILEWAKANPENELYTRLLIATGARCSTLNALRVGDLKDNHISFRNIKGGKRYDYLILLNDIRAVELWGQLANGKKPTDSLFTDAVITSRRIKWFMYKNIEPDINGERLSPHSFRHGLATKLVQNGVDISTIARILDHSTPTVTYTYYAKHDQRQLDEALSDVSDK